METTDVGADVGAWERLFVGLTEPVHLAWLLAGAIFLAFYAWQKFNQWTPAELKKFFDLRSPGPPRHFTSWSSFLAHAILYVLVMQLFYVLLIVLMRAPHAMGFVTHHILSREATEIAHYSVFIALLLITGVLPTLPALNRAELFLRERLHNKAFIPAEANRVVRDLQYHDDEFRPSIDEVCAVLNETEFHRLGGIQFDLDDFTPANSLRHQWLKLTFLYYKLTERRADRSVERAMEPMYPAYQSFEGRYKNLRSHIKKYMDKVGSQEHEAEPAYLAEYLEWVESEVKEQLQDLLKEVLTFISCSFYATEKLPQTQDDAFARFGLYPRSRIHIPMDWDTIITTAIVMFLAILVPTLIYYFMAPAAAEEVKATLLMPQNTQDALMWSVTGLLSHGLAILAALAVCRGGAGGTLLSGSSKRHRIDQSVTRSFLAGLAGYAVGLLVMLAMVWMPGRDAPVEYQSLQRLYLWGALPATTAFFTSFHLDRYIYAIPPQYSRWKAAAIQGLVTGAVGFFVVLLYWSDLDTKGAMPYYFLIFVVVTVAAMGAAIGYTFPEGYRRRVGARFGINRRRFPRLEKRIPVSVKADGQEYSARIVDISTTGLRVNFAVPMPLYSRVDLSVDEIGGLDARVGRKDDDETFFRFHDLDGTSSDRLRNFLERAVAD